MSLNGLSIALTLTLTLLMDVLVPPNPDPILNPSPNPVAGRPCTDVYNRVANLICMNRSHHFSKTYFRIQDVFPNPNSNLTLT